MQRPILSDTSFLAHVFGPKRNPKPTGIRKSKPLKGVKGQNKGRIAAFNRMSPVSQELLKRSGLKESYLRGQTTLSDAKRTVRPQAISLGLAKPVPGQPTVIRVPRPPTRREQIDFQVARHIKVTLARSDKRFSPQGIDTRVPRIPDYIVEHVKTWDYDQLSAAAGTGSPFEIIEEGTRFNPFWYQ